MKPTRGLEKINSGTAIGQRVVDHGNQSGSKEKVTR